MPGYLKANCRKNFNPLKTLLPYSLTCRKWPSKLGGFETEIGKSAASTASLQWRCCWRASDWPASCAQQPWEKRAQQKSTGSPAAWLAGGSSQAPSRQACHFSSRLFARSAGRCSDIRYEAILNAPNWLTRHLTGATSHVPVDLAISTARSK